MYQGFSVHKNSIILAPKYIHSFIEFLQYVPTTLLRFDGQDFAKKFMPDVVVMLSH